jgi:hypothetical protein
MNLKSLFSLFTLSALMVSAFTAPVAFSQDSAKADQTRVDQSKADKEKAQEAIEKKALSLLEEVLKEAVNLRLAENRIRVQALAAELLWKRDEKRARALFKQATDSFVELLAVEDGGAPSQVGFVIESFRSSQTGRYPALEQARAQLRQEILQLLTGHDAKLARDFLRATSKPADRENPGYSNMNAETELDLNLASQVAATDPKQALQIAEEYLEKGLPYGLANVLFQLQKKDTEAAAKLAGGIMKKLRGENFVTNHEAATLAMLLLGQEINPGADNSGADNSGADKTRTGSNSTLMLDENAIRELIDMMVTACLNQLTAKAANSDEAEDDDHPLLNSLESLMPMIEKYAPSRASLLRKKITEYEGTLDPRAKAYKEYQKVIEKGDSQALVEATAKASPEMKPALAMQAIMKAASEGEFDRARQIINDHVADAEQRKQMLAGIDQQMLQRASMLGKMDEARPILARLSPEVRATVLAQFAVAAAGKGDKKLALQLLDEARNLLGAQAANYSELGALLQIAQIYASIEPSRSFDIIEPTVEQLNVLLSAIASLDGFEYWQHFKDGELIGSGPSVVVNSTLQCARDLALLSRSDFDRAKATADRFSRSDVRVTARLFVAQGVLSNQLPIGNLPVQGRQVFYTPF